MFISVWFIMFRSNSGFLLFGMTKKTLPYRQGKNWF